MSETSDVVIVGGGVAGCAVAYYLGLAGVKSTIIEREGLGTQASGYSAGGLNPLQGLGIPGPLSDLSNESYRMHLDLWDVLKEQTGIDYEGHIVSLLQVAFDETEASGLEDTIEAFSDADGFDAHRLDPDEVSDLEPRIGPGVVAGVYARGNASIDSYKYTLALGQAAEQMGARVRFGTVRLLERDHGRITAVVLNDGIVHCGQVVLAMGPWSRQAEPWLDTYIPVDPLKGEILRLRLPGPALAHNISGGGGSLYSKPDGLVWSAATEEWRGFDKETSESARLSLLERATRLVPDVANAAIVQQTACLRPVTPDWLPCIGKLPEWENVYLATGAGKKGVLLSPGIGKAVADLMVDGETGLSIEGFSPSRFDPMPSMD